MLIPVIMLVVLVIWAYFVVRRVAEFNATFKGLGLDISISSRRSQDKRLKKPDVVEIARGE